MVDWACMPSSSGEGKNENRILVEKSHKNSHMEQGGQWNIRTRMYIELAQDHVPWWASVKQSISQSGIYYTFIKSIQGSTNLLDTEFVAK
jgi:hypothetical protein